VEFSVVVMGSAVGVVTSVAFVVASFVVVSAVISVAFVVFVFAVTSVAFVAVSSADAKVQKKKARRILLTGIVDG